MLCWILWSLLHSYINNKWNKNISLVMSKTLKDQSRKKYQDNNEKERYTNFDPKLKKRIRKQEKKKRQERRKRSL